MLPGSVHWIKASAGPFRGGGELCSPSLPGQEQWGEGEGAGEDRGHGDQDSPAPVLSWSGILSLWTKTPETKS